jgi:hypothetical protein
MYVCICIYIYICICIYVCVCVRSYVICFMQAYIVYFVNCHMITHTNKDIHAHTKASTHKHPNHQYFFFSGTIEARMHGHMQVVEGMGVVRMMEDVQTDQNDRPTRPVAIQCVTTHRLPVKITTCISHQQGCPCQTCVP